MPDGAQDDEDLLDPIVYLQSDPERCMKVI
jgi:hypothetical protein